MKNKDVKVHSGSMFGLSKKEAETITDEFFELTKKAKRFDTLLKKLKIKHDNVSHLKLFLLGRFVEEKERERRTISQMKKLNSVFKKVMK